MCVCNLDSISLMHRLLLVMCVCNLNSISHAQVVAGQVRMCVYNLNSVNLMHWKGSHEHV